MGKETGDIVLRGERDLWAAREKISVGFKEGERVRETYGVGSRSDDINFVVFPVEAEESAWSQGDQISS